MEENKDRKLGEREGGRIKKKENKTKFRNEEMRMIRKREIRGDRGYKSGKIEGKKREMRDEREINKVERIKNSRVVKNREKERENLKRERVPSSSFPPLFCFAFLFLNGFFNWAQKGFFLDSPLIP